MCGNGWIVSIPLEQGNVFRLAAFLDALHSNVSIPLEQGNVFRPKKSLGLKTRQQSQSL